MFIVYGYNEDLEKIYTSLPEDPKAFIKTVIGFAQESSQSFYNFMVENKLAFISIERLGNTLALVGIDDLIVEFNLYALRRDPELIKLFQELYPDKDIDLYSDLKTKLPEATKEMFSKSYKEEIQYYKLTIESLQVSGKTYDLESSKELLKNESYNLNFYIANYAQDSVMALGAPPYGSKYVRADIRPISEIENYVFALYNSNEKDLYSTDLCFFLPYTEERLSILRKENKCI